MQRVSWVRGTTLLHLARRARLESRKTMRCVPGMRAEWATFVSTERPREDAKETERGLAGLSREPGGPPQRGRRPPARKLCRSELSWQLKPAQTLCELSWRASLRPMPIRFPTPDVQAPGPPRPKIEDRSDVSAFRRSHLVGMQRVVDRSSHCRKALHVLLRVCAHRYRHKRIIIHRHKHRNRQRHKFTTRARCALHRRLGSRGLHRSHTLRSHRSS